MHSLIALHFAACGIEVSFNASVGTFYPVQHSRNEVRLIWTHTGPAQQLDSEVLSLLEAQPAERATGARSISVYRLKARVAAVDELSGFAEQPVRICLGFCLYQQHAFHHTLNSMYACFGRDAPLSLDNSGE